jgi:transposase
MARPQRRYPPEFREQAVEFFLSVADYRSMRDVAQELGIHVNNLRRWVKAVDKPPAPMPVSSAERAELMRLRKENRILKEELEISKKAAAFFARERSRG